MGPFEAIGQICALVRVILEGIPVEQRRATAIALFWAFWPLWKLNPEVAAHEKEILAAMEAIGKP